VPWSRPHLFIEPPSEKSRWLSGAWPDAPTRRTPAFGQSESGRFRPSTWPLLNLARWITTVENGQRHSQRLTGRTRRMTGCTAAASVPAPARASHSTIWLVVSTTESSTTWTPITSSKLPKRVFNDLTRLESGPLCVASRAFEMSTSLWSNAPPVRQVTLCQQRSVTELKLLLSAPTDQTRQGWVRSPLS
jgi:hypothetical protein